MAVWATATWMSETSFKYLFSSNQCLIGNQSRILELVQKNWLKSWKPLRLWKSWKSWNVFNLNIRCNPFREQVTRVQIQSARRKQEDSMAIIFLGIVLVRSMWNFKCSITFMPYHFDRTQFVYRFSLLFTGLCVKNIWLWLAKLLVACPGLFYKSGVRFHYQMPPS